MAQRSLFFLIFLSLSMLWYQGIYASPYGIGKYNENVPYGGQTSLTISNSGNVSFSVVPSESGTLATGSGTVTVLSSDVIGFRLYVRDSDGTTALTKGADSIPASSNVVAAALANNTWGYNIDGSSDFVGITTADVLLKTVTGPSYAVSDVTTVTYGAKVTTAKASGQYTDTVMFTAVPRTD